MAQNNPESNEILSYRYPKTVPGNSLYSSLSENGKSIGIFGDSMTKRILGAKISKDIGFGKAKVRSFVGATAAELDYHIIPEITKHKYDIAIICAGTNNIPPAPIPNSDRFLEQTPDEIAQEIVNIGFCCKDRGINDVAISLLTIRKGYEKKIRDVNNLLIDYCRAAHFYFIDHSNILLQHLYDGLHIDSQFLYLYANNITKLLNSL